MPAQNKPYHVYKFGGTSVGTPERIRHVVQLIESAPVGTRKVVVISAFGGVTDTLKTAIDSALVRSTKYRAIIQEIQDRHANAIDQLSESSERIDLKAASTDIWNELRELLDGVYLLRECTDRTRDAIMGMGERESAPILAAALRSSGNDAKSFDSRYLIRTDASFGEANVDFTVTKGQIKASLGPLDTDTIAVVTGFIASTERGEATTLGRSGSDYTATILADALKAERVVIWTDVDGVLSADPGLVPSAFTLPQLSYREAAEMAYFGARVLHPRTMRPIRESGIPLQIKNTTNPEAEGTLIRADSPETDGHVKAITAVRGISLIMLEGAGMMGVPGISAKMFATLATHDINVLLISQASSEQSICVGIKQERSEEAVQALNQAFELDLQRGDVSKIFAMDDCAVVSAVGDHMRLKPGLAGRMFSTLGRANINVLAIAQGASETNISTVIADSDIERGVRALHETFARSYERLHLFLLGPGVVGSRLLEILERQAPALSEEFHINLRLAGVASSSAVLWDAEGIPFAEALTRLAEEGEPMAVPDLVSMLQRSHLERLVVVDASASGEIASVYIELLTHGIAVVTPNKRANTAGQEYYDRLQEVSRRMDVPFLYETTVGAALPVIGTLRDLVRSGDRIHKIQGVLSGTLAYVFNEMCGGVSFSEAVTEARLRGYTEPDPREDLAGEDVARKILTLAREAGRRLELEDVQVESLVPENMKSLDVESFMKNLTDMDKMWADRMADGPMQYIATLDENGCRVGIERIAEISPFSNLDGTDNLIVFTTDRYSERPLVIQGAGAGPDVTAAGILSDILKVAERML